MFSIKTFKSQMSFLKHVKLIKKTVEGNIIN